MRYIYSILILFLSIINITQVISEEFKIPPEAILAEPIYGEENAPENIYYKYIRNNISEGFFYSLFRSKNFVNKNVTIIFIIPVQGDDAIFLILNESFNFINQYSIIHNPYFFSHLGKEIFFSAKYPIDHPSVMTDLYHYLFEQLEFEYKLISKEDLEMVLELVLPDDARVYIDEFNRNSINYVRRKN